MTSTSTNSNCTPKRAGTIDFITRCALTALYGLTITILLPNQAAAGIGTRGIFETYEKKSDNINIFKKWISVLNRSKAEQYLESELCAVEGGSWCVLRRWREFLANIAKQPRKKQLDAINKFVNRTHYISDQRNYSMVDHWATPRQFFSRGGDCEDYAIIKYLSLRALGWKPEQMRLAVVIDRVKRQAHAILLVYHNSAILILDNQNPEILENTAVVRYKPVYSINEKHWWFHVAAKN